MLRLLKQMQAEAKEAALKEKFDQYVKASADKLKFFQAQFDSACTMRCEQACRFCNLQ
eukprot:SAG31_NODE_1445_length_8320_cov_3.454081_13_plen_58_part_00